MAIFASRTRARLQAGGLALGMGVQHLRTAATPMLAQAAGYDWLFLDCEHGAFSIHEVTQICLACLPTGVTPLVRVCADALDEGTRALDNGAMGIVVPHVDTAEQARRIADRFRFPPRGHRSWGGGIAQFGYQAPPMGQAQAEIDAEILIVAMIESPEAVANADAIAAVPGIDVLLVGTSDLSTEMGIPGDLGHARIGEAYAALATACRRHGKVLGMGGIYDEEHAARYIGLGARMIIAGSDQMFLMQGASARTQVLRRIGEGAGAG